MAPALFENRLEVSGGLGAIVISPKDQAGFIRSRADSASLKTRSAYSVSSAALARSASVSPAALIGVVPFVFLNDRHLQRAFTIEVQRADVQ